MMASLRVLLFFLLLAPSVWGEPAAGVVSLQHVEAEVAVTRAHEVLGPEIEQVTVVADPNTNRIAILDTGRREAELLEEFFGVLDLPNGTRGLTVVSLRHVAAHEAGQAVREALGKDVPGVRTVVFRRSNRILIGGAAPARQRVEDFLLGLDRPPRQVRLEAVLTRVQRDAAGGDLRTVLTNPTLLLGDGETGVMATCAQSGEVFELKLTPTILDPAGKP